MISGRPWWAEYGRKIKQRKHVEKLSLERPKMKWNDLLLPFVERSCQCFRLCINFYQQGYRTTLLKVTREVVKSNK